MPEFEIRHDYEPAAFTIEKDFAEIYFCGPIPIEGDRVELVCSSATDVHGQHR